MIHENRTAKGSVGRASFMRHLLLSQGSNADITLVVLRYFR
jgi:hypothetical protein